MAQWLPMSHCCLGASKLSGSFLVRRIIATSDNTCSKLLGPGQHVIIRRAWATRVRPLAPPSLEVPPDLPRFSRGLRGWLIGVVGCLVGCYVRTYGDRPGDEPRLFMCKVRPAQVIFRPRSRISAFLQFMPDATDVG
ncbi:hypothetical protein Nepgr_014818 [Nepenthes gracilis]|uniref:Uncharacterized protein n=1 Tax=Nepenthes gracilis TaxID=150966 RepID=A0AAD3SLY7_NEPGR|nr:hypothetical protein Nepgr_014818 [Nepenthes gracilis]